MQIRADTIGEAHTKVCRAIFEDGDEIITEDGEITIEYPEPVMIIVNKPYHSPKVSSFNNLSSKAMNEYAKQLLTVNESDFAYTYGNRMFDYPVPRATIEGLCKFVGDGDSEGFNQIIWCVNMLIAEPNTRRAVVMIRHPEIDCNSNNPPCLTIVQFMIRDNWLHTTAYFRSNDMLSAWGNNAYGLEALSNFVYKQIFALSKQKNEDGLYYSDICKGCKTLTTISNSAHMYPIRDAEEIKKLKIEIYK